jgi:hypothetical protein
MKHHIKHVMQRKTVDITAAEAKGKVEIVPPRNPITSLPGQNEQESAAGAAAAAVSTSASPVGMAPVDNTGSAGSLTSTSLVQSTTTCPAFESVSGQTIDITGASILCARGHCKGASLTTTILTAWIDCIVFLADHLVQCTGHIKTNMW